MKSYWLIMGLLIVWTSRAQSPTDLLTNVKLTPRIQSDFAPNAFFSTAAQVVAAFNAGRRAEESQLKLTANSLGNLALPANYPALSVASRALFLINAERKARAGVVYPRAGAVLGLPLEGLERALTATAQQRAQYLVERNAFSHTGPGRQTPFDRVDKAYPAACRTPMGYGENLYVVCTNQTVAPPFLIEQAIFSWLYRDAESKWGHRRAILIQNDDRYLAPPPSMFRGFVNDRGGADSEGFLGIGVASSAIGKFPVSCSGSTAGHVVVMNIADPTADAGCSFQVQP